jgi:hypothetical protein
VVINISLDLEKWDKEYGEDFDKLVYSLIESVKRNGFISILDLAPEHKNALKDSAYGLWVAPGDPVSAKTIPGASLASYLDPTKPTPQNLLVPLGLTKNKSEFMYTYGLGKDLGIDFEDFLGLIHRGYVRLVLTEKPINYTPGFYQEIFRECQECEMEPYLPPFTLATFNCLTMSMNEISLSPGYWFDRSKELLSDEKCNDIIRDFLIMAAQLLITIKCVTDLAQQLLPYQIQA